MPRIIDRLEDFGKELIDFISDSSEEGNKRLQEIFKQASKEYNQYQDSYLWSWLYYYTRQRTAAFEKTISALTTVVDPIIQLQEFRKFVSEGEWKSTSANIDLYIFLIRSIEGYEPEEDHVLRTVIIPRLNQLICKDIDNLIKAHENAMQEAEKRKKELEAMLAGKRKEMENVVLFGAENTAMETAVESPEKQVFSLIRLSPEAESSDWQLTWYDSTGKANRLEIYGELKQLLQEIKVLPEENSSRQFKIKSACTKLVDELLAKTQVLVNPAPELLKDLTSTYVLSTKPMQIVWYDSLGNHQPLNLHKYPQLEAWLGPKTEFTEKDLPRLKMYLRHIVVRREVDEDKQSNVFELLRKKHGETLIATNSIAAVPPYKLTAGTYLLIREPDAKTGAWVLYQRQKGGINQRINTDNWEAFHEILAQNKDFSAAELSLVEKNKLRECIKKADKILVKSKSLCVAVNHFSADNPGTYDPGTFIVTKQKEQWQLFYIDMLQKAIEVDLTQCSQVKPLFAQWSGLPEVLGTVQLGELSKLLADFKPAARLKGVDVSELERCLAAGKQKKEKQGAEEPNLTTQTLTSPEVPSKSLCLAVNHFSPANAAGYKPRSFIVTKLEDQWQLFYIDSLQKVIPVDLDQCKQVKPLFAQWLVMPESLGEDELEALSKSLGSYRPAARLPSQDLSAVEKFLFGRQQAQTHPQPTMVDSPTIPEKMQQVSQPRLFNNMAKIPPGSDDIDSPVFTV
ncbi:Uncharacterised protein [Legionella donaldsonii]|uniref:Uncharacterized protein n=1 Tax=Legionella donaldsonii TaxID=45060 RepID=A0A378JAG4_9GAMM|nr:hypothetical protein [Legionella donaldsonii]STX41570.1 Uncharacterised protein [Legionella donaldsonii]